MSAGERDVAIVGAGAFTPVGRGVDTLWRSLLDAKPAMAPYRHPDLPELARVLVAEAPGLDPTTLASPAELARMDRFHLLAAAAADDALAGIVARPPASRCAVVVGVGYGAAAGLERMHRTVTDHGTKGLSSFAVPANMANSAAASLALRHGFQGPCLTIGTACASGADAIGQGAELLRRGAADLVLAGGVDAVVALTMVLGFFRMGVLTRNPDPATASRPFDADRDGLVLGEGAGFVVMQRSPDAERQRRDVLGRVSGYGANCDAFHIAAPDPEGLAVRRCAELALLDASVEPHQIGHINAHGTSTPRSDAAESAAMCALFSGNPPPITATKGVTGHMIGGSGAVEVIVTILALRHGLVPPVAGHRTRDPAIPLDIIANQSRQIAAKYAISNSLGFGGHNAVLVLGAP